MTNQYTTDESRFKTKQVVIAGCGEQTATTLEESLGCSTTTVDAGSDVLDYLERTGSRTADGVERSVACIVSDDILPDMPGFELLERVRDTSPAVPFLLFLGPDSSAEEALAAGATEFVRKGAGTDESMILAHRIERILDRRRTRGQTAQLEAGMTALSRLYEVIADAKLPLEEKIQRVLRLGTEQLGFSIGYYTRISDGTQEILAAVGDHENIQPGETDPLDRTYCRQTIESGKTTILTDALTEGWEGDPAFERFDLRSYVGGHVTVDGETAGTICFADEEPRPDLAEDVYETIIEGLAQWAGYELERRRYERELEFVEELVESVGVGVVVYGESGVYEYVNQAYSDLFGVETDRLLDVSIWDVTSAFERDTFQTYLESLDSGETRRIETTHEFAGTSVPVEAITTCAEIHGDRYHFGTVVDVTERRERRRELELLHEATRELMEADTDETVAESAATILRDILDFERNVVRFVDEEGNLAPAATTREAHATLGVRPRYLISGDNPAARAYNTGESVVVEDVRDLDDEYERGEMRSGMYVPIGSHGVISIIDSSVDAFDSDDERIASILASNAETALDRLEYEQELERQNERLERYASVAAHDLRNPVNTATFTLSKLKEQCDNEYVSELEMTLERMETIIDYTLELAREGKTVTEMEKVAVASLARECWWMIDANEADLEISESFSIQADPKRLKHAFENLFTNAVEHGGSDVTVRVGPSSDRRFFVEDDGQGLPEYESADVFEAGYSSQEDGTGFGLTIVQEIAHAHGWDVDIMESESGGVRFEFSGVEGLTTFRT